MEEVLNNISKDKSPGLDKRIVDFFIFFDILGGEILELIEEYIIKDCVSRDLNSTFLAMIHKCDKPTIFQDYRPISLCNLIYKIITKIISNRIKTKLVDLMAKEQFGILSNKFFLDAIGVTQEVIHLVKIKKMDALILKMDFRLGLYEAYPSRDRASS